MNESGRDKMIERASPLGTEWLNLSLCLDLSIHPVQVVQSAKKFIIEVTNTSAHVLRTPFKPRRYLPRKRYDRQKTWGYSIRPLFETGFFEDPENMISMAARIFFMLYIDLLKEFLLLINKYFRVLKPNDCLCSIKMSATNRWIVSIFTRSWLWLLITYRGHFDITIWLTVEVSETRLIPESWGK